MSYDPVSQTPIIGLTYTSDAAMNANLQKIDNAFGKLGLEPPAPVEVEPVAEEPPPPPPGGEPQPE
jgi:hypothetical protein